MDRPPPIALFEVRPPPLMRRRFLHAKKAAFSLVEIVLAIGIVSFAFLPLLGLLPTGLTAFRGSIDTSIVSRILQKIGNEAQQSDYETVTSSTSFRFFDDQGIELKAADKQKAIYQARLVVADVAGTAHLKRLIVQVARHPDGAVALLESPRDGVGMVWSQRNTSPVFTRSMLLARTSSVPRN